MICMGRRERAGDVNALGRGDDWGRLSENSKDGKFSPTNNEKTGINCQYISHFNAENCNENGIESHQLLVFGQSGGGRVNYCFFACLEQFLSLATDHFLYGGSRFYGI